MLFFLAASTYHSNLTCYSQPQTIIPSSTFVKSPPLSHTITNCFMYSSYSYHIQYRNHMHALSLHYSATLVQIPVPLHEDLLFYNHCEGLSKKLYYQRPARPLYTMHGPAAFYWVTHDVIGNVILSGVMTNVPVKPLVSSPYV